MALHSDFGVDSCDVDLREVNADHLHADICALFEQHSPLLFREQHLYDEEQRSFGRCGWGSRNAQTLKALAVMSKLLKIDPHERET